MRPLGFTALLGSSLFATSLALPHRKPTVGAVVSANEECDELGRSILHQGGNAVDSIIAVSFCIGVVDPALSGIGGGGYLVVRSPSGNYETIDFRETAPALASKNMFTDDPERSVFGGLAIAVPGEVRGMQALHEKYGSLPWKDLVLPTADLAANGYTVTDNTVLSMLLGMKAYGQKYILEDPTWSQDFAPNGHLVQAGDIATRKRLAKTLYTIAEQGPDAFYRGEIAESIVETVQKHHGILSLHDLARYQVISRGTVETTYRDQYRLVSTPLPSNGIVCLNILKIMERYDPQLVVRNATTGQDDFGLAFHRLNEAMRFSYGARPQLADPDFVPNATSVQDTILDKHHIDKIYHQIKDDTTQPVDAYHLNNTFAVDSHGTSQYVASDASGLTVSVTSTVNTYFGAIVMDPKTGIILNNEMNDFSIPGTKNKFGYEPSVANYVAPGKRPLSSISPVIVEHLRNGTVYVAIGGAGGSRIPSSTASVLWHLFDHGFPLAKSIAYPRIHDQVLPNTVQVEKGLDARIEAGLEERHHNITHFRLALSKVHGILWADALTPIPARDGRQLRDLLPDHPPSFNSFNEIDEVDERMDEHHANSEL